ncbi:Sedlin [Trichoderma ceciliae]
MSAVIPTVACLGVIGRNNNPLHISIFPSYDPTANAFTPIRNPLQFSLLLSSTIDVFDLRSRNSTASGDFGLLHAIDDRLAAYGFETNTGVRMVCVVDMRGRRVEAGGSGVTGPSGGASGASTSSSSAAAARSSVGSVGAGLRDAELKPVFRAMQSAYVRLLQNPFYDPDEHAPLGGKGGRRITSKKFGDDMKRIGEGWTPGVTTL